MPKSKESCRNQLLKAAGLQVSDLQPCNGKGVRIAVLDSGVNPEFPLIAGSKGTFHLCEERGVGLEVSALDREENSDTSGHGSCVQSCVLKVAPEATVDHYRILDEFNNCSSRLLCLVLDHVLEKGYDLINLSLGTRNEALVAWLVSIMKRAYEQNIAIVAASSNIGNSLFPGRFTYCVSVAGVSGVEDNSVRYRSRDVIEFGGHGVNVAVPVSEEREVLVTGSSYASGHVTGVCARVLEKLGPLDPLALKVALRAIAEEETAQAS